MDERERPPPYNEGFTNPGYGKPYTDAEEFKPIAMASQPEQQPIYPNEDFKPITVAPQLQGQPIYPDEDYKPITMPPQPQRQPVYQDAQAFIPVALAPQPQQVSHTNVIVVGNGGPVPGCPVCHNGKWTGTYSCCAWLWCICCFPVGIICCLCMRKKKCTHCGYTVG